MMDDKLLFGKDPTERIVSCGVKDGVLEIFTEENGEVKSKFQPYRYWLLAPRKLDWGYVELAGNLHYKWIKTFDHEKSFWIERRKYANEDLFYISDPKEAAMVFNGFTYFKGMKVSDVSALFFDLESTGLQHNDLSKVLLISNTFVKNGVATRKLFSYSDYESDMDFFDAWCKWVREMNPSVMCGHNIFGYDLPYLKFCAENAGTTLTLGRDGSDLYISKKPSQFRKDGSQAYDYFRSYIYGREIVDTKFVAYHFDFARKYESYSLKKIIEQEGLELPGRVFYNAVTIKDNYQNPVEWEKIKKYAEFDADDAWSLYKLMIPAYFYLNQNVPKTFQQINYSASGSQINAFLIRSYIQLGHSLPKATPGQAFEGAISMGNPGKYKNVFKIDVASLYPSIMLQYEIYDPLKDPKGHFLQMVNAFTTERLKNKKLGKETNDRYYKELEQAQKIIINSAYGMLGAHGLLFNSPKNAELVTKYGREILQKVLLFAEQHHFVLVNADTDSVSIAFDDMSPISKDTRQEILQAVNSMFPDKIKWEDDGMYQSVIILKAKNYILKKEDGTVKIKGSALKSSKTEKALKKFMGDVIDRLLNDKEPEITDIYHKYIYDIHHLTEIEPWCSTKTITDKVLNPQRTNEQKILDAINPTEVEMGDKLLFYFDENSALKQPKDWKNDHHRGKMVSKLYKTLEIFDEVLDMTQFKKYHLKNKKIQEELQKLIIP
jgi:DNA polymerase I